MQCWNVLPIVVVLNVFYALGCRSGWRPVMSSNAMISCSFDARICSMLHSSFECQQARWAITESMFCCVSKKYSTPTTPKPRTFSTKMQVASTTNVKVDVSSTPTTMQVLSTSNTKMQVLSTSTTVTLKEDGQETSDSSTTIVGNNQTEAQSISVFTSFSLIPVNVSSSLAETTTAQSTAYIDSSTLDKRIVEANETTTDGVKTIAADEHSENQRPTTTNIIVFESAEKLVTASTVVVDDLHVADLLMAMLKGRTKTTTLDKIESTSGSSSNTEATFENSSQTESIIENTYSTESTFSFDGHFTDSSPFDEETASTAAVVTSSPVADLTPFPVKVKPVLDGVTQVVQIIEGKRATRLSTRMMQERSWASVTLLRTANKNILVGAGSPTDKAFILNYLRNELQVEPATDVSHVIINQEMLDTVGAVSEFTSADVVTPNVYKKPAHQLNHPSLAGRTWYLDDGIVIVPTAGIFGREISVLVKNAVHFGRVAIVGQLFANPGDNMALLHIPRAAYARRLRNRRKIICGVDWVIPLYDKMFQITSVMRKRANCTSIE